MKRVTIAFTIINILVILVMLVNIAFEYNKPGYVSVSPSICVIYSILYVPPLILINLVFRAVCRVKIRQAPDCVQVSKDSDRKTVSEKHINIIFLLLDILILAVMMIHIFVFRENGIDFDKVIYYFIPLIIVNDAWFVVHMRLKYCIA